MSPIQAILQTQSRQLQRQTARQLGRATTTERAVLTRSVGITKYLLKIKLRLREEKARRSRVLTLKLKQAPLPDDVTTEEVEAKKPDRKKPTIESKNVVGLKYLELVALLLKRLREDGCTRDWGSTNHSKRSTRQSRSSTVRSSQLCQAFLRLHSSRLTIRLNW